MYGIKTNNAVIPLFSLYPTWTQILIYFFSIVPAALATSYKSKFIYDFWHLNVAMYTSNNALIPDRDKEDILASTPDQWPLLTVGLRMCGWADNAIKFYLLGNPIVWWSGTVSLALYTMLLLFYMVRRKRHYHIRKYYIVNDNILAIASSLTLPLF